MEKTINIKNAKYISEYKISLTFDDKTKKVVDFENFIKKAQHPDIKKYQNLTLFKKFNVNYGDLEWNGYELAFPIYDLYGNNI